MDPTEQVYEAEATPLQRGLYADIRHTLRAPIVNSIWRTLVANVPELTPYIWAQLKPAFQTREFAAVSVAYRDHVLTAVEADLPRYDPIAVGLDPAQATELRDQLATFDVVAPRLAVVFGLLDRRLNDRAVGTDAGGEAATAPFPAWLDDGRGRPPTMVDQSTASAVLPEGLDRGFGAMVPSIYRCLAQWPAYLDRAAADVEPLLDAAAYRTATTGAADLVDTYLDRLAYTPRLDPDGLAAAGADAETVEALRDLSGTFRSGGEGLLPLLHVYAASVGAAGERDALSVP
jgi:hypothetical protein